ncbi:MAG: histidinol-phosphatase [Gammaproteobacteria bacterium]|jgi:histidinol phosphatase-like enzyme (inositol monophosphatase family)
MTEATPESFLPFAERLAEASGEVIRRYFRVSAAEMKLEAKSDDTPVTIADRSAEEVMRALIEETYPDHGIYGEEYGFVRTDAEYAWTLDPIDGTKSFVTGMPIFGTLISLMHEGRPVLGMINQPVLGERWIGVAGRQSTFNGQPISTSGVTKLADAAQYSTDPDMFSRPEDRRKVDAVLAEVKSKRYGGDCYSYALLANGFVDLVIEFGLKIFDFMALVPVIEGAGGVMTDWNGNRLTRESDGHVVAAASPECHAAAVAHLRDP